VQGSVPAIPRLKMLRQEKLEFKTNLGYIERPCLKTKANKQTKTLRLKGM
jgi:hypothetical protein